MVEMQEWQKENEEFRYMLNILDNSCDDWRALYRSVWITSLDMTGSKLCDGVDDSLYHRYRTLGSGKRFVFDFT